MRKVLGLSVVVLGLAASAAATGKTFSGIVKINLPDGSKAVSKISLKKS